jgi:hypothetical protein
MSAVRLLRLPAGVLVAAVVVATVGVAPAIAGKPAPAPKNLGATVTAHANGTYDVAASWDAVPNATSYRVSLTKGGTTLSSATVTTRSWTPKISSSPGDASLSVRGVVGRKPGRTATVSVPLPDVTPPSGSYSSSWNNDTGQATITEESLTDNAPVAGVTRVVDWHDPSHPGTVSWASGTTLQHTYDLTEARYVPTVTLEDAAHNSVVVDVPAVVIKDAVGPAGAFSVSPADAWSAFTRVTVTQDGALSDNWSPADHIARSVDWGDGTTDAWTSGDSLSHVYATAATYAPAVTITDEAHNDTVVPTSDVVVSTDSTGPVVKLRAPKAKHSVRAWRTVRGKATDAGTGVKVVWLKAVEKRGAAWYGYNAKTHAWAKAASKTKAFAKAKAFHRTTDSQNRWTATLAHLTKGTLVVKVRATDQVKNRSATLTRPATLTKP